LRSRALSAALPSSGTTDPARLGVLAAILYNPLLLVGYLLYLYGPSAHCVAGPLCKFGTYPGAIQIVLLLLGIWLLWLLLVVVVRRILEAPGWQGRLTRWLRALSDYESVKELLGAYAVALLVVLLISFMAHVLTPTALILGGFTAAVSIRAALLRDLPRDLPHEAPTLADPGRSRPRGAVPITSLPIAPAPFSTPPFSTPPFSTPSFSSTPLAAPPLPAPPYEPIYDQPTTYSPPIFSRPTDPPPPSRPWEGQPWDGAGPGQGQEL
jgi:hypothetical protein